MSKKTFTTTVLGLLVVTLSAWCSLRGATQGRDASRPGQGPSAAPMPARTPRRPRANKGVSQVRVPTRRFVTVTIISNLPYCNVLIDGEPEERGTDGQGRLSIPMEPGLYEVSLTNPGHV